MVRRRPSVVRPPQCSNIFFSETAWPIKAKFYVEPPWVGGTKFCSQHLGHMTKMAATPIYGKNPSKIFFSRTGRPIFTKLGMLHQGLQPIINCSNDDPGVTLTLKVCAKVVYIQKFKTDFLRNYCAYLNPILYASFRYKETKI